jgi:hypothetical protein
MTLIPNKISQAKAEVRGRQPRLQWDIQGWVTLIGSVTPGGEAPISTGPAERYSMSLFIVNVVYYRHLI